MGKAFGKVLRIILRLDGWKGRRIVGQNIHGNLRVNITWFFTCLFFPGGVLPYLSHIGMCPPSSRVFAPFFGLKFKKQVYTLAILVWNRVWFSRELRECMNVFIVSIRSE